MTTVDLELAQELQSVCEEKGIELPDHYWGWFYQEITESNILLPMFTNTLSEYLAPAYTLDELLELLPKTIPSRGMVREYRWRLTPNMYNYETYDIGYYDHEGCRMVITDNPNPANAACKLLIWLIKKGFIK